MPLAGIRVVVDCAHGAAYDLAPRMLRRAGAEVIAIGVEPDGDNINSGCGSTSLDALRGRRSSSTAPTPGIAHDGDADRCLAVDADGEVIDGDQIIAVLAFALQGRGPAGATTRSWSPSCPTSACGWPCGDAGITVVETPVGDRYVLAAMRGRQATCSAASSPATSSCRPRHDRRRLLTALHLLATAAGDRPVARANWPR